MSDKWQTQDEFWNSFGIPAYDENTVPDEAVMPYITYGAVVSNFENPITLLASIWYRETSWKNISELADRIASYIGKSYKAIKVDGGYMVLSLGAPFAQRMADEDDSVRRMYLMVDTEFYTEV